MRDDSKATPTLPARSPAGGPPRDGHRLPDGQPSAGRPPYPAGDLDEELGHLDNRSALATVLGVLALALAAAAVIVAFAVRGGEGEEGPAAPAAGAAEPAADLSAAAGKGVEFEAYRRPDPTLPEPPPGEVKRFRVDVYEHVTKVHKDLYPTRVWSYGVNGVLHRGTGVSPPLVVTEGDEVEITLVNGGSEKMNVTMPHSIDFHSSEVNPGEAFATIQPGETHRFSFTAKHPGVFMYHCATDPVLHHTGAGMVGAMIVKPKNLLPADRELWLTQQEYYFGPPGKDADLVKMQAKRPDVIAFNGYADQYKERPIQVKRGERIRMYLMNAGPSIWSAFHVIGTVFDRTVIEGARGSHAQTVNLAPSQGGWVELTLDKEGTYPFVTHAFGDMVKGALGVLATENPPEAAGAKGERAAAAPAPQATGEGEVGAELGDMFVKLDGAEAKAGEVTFKVRNAGQLPHSFAIERGKATAGGDGSGALAKTEVLKPGESAELKVKLPAGTYELYCTVPGHYAAGQKTDLKVRA